MKISLAFNATKKKENKRKCYKYDQNISVMLLKMHFQEYNFVKKGKKKI